MLRLILIALLLTLTGFTEAQTRVVASIGPYGQLAEQVGGDAVEVSVLLPAGASPHTFEPTPSAAARLADADLVLLNGGTDEWLRELAASVNPEVTIVEGLEVLGEQLAASESSSGDQSHLGVNPHVWLDPLLMAEIAEAVGNELAALDPTRRDTYRDRAAEVVNDLASLDEELRKMLLPVRGAPFIPFHDAWPYFARRYGLDLIMEVEPFPGREPSPRYLAAVVEAIRESGAPAIFNEAGLSDRAARVLAQEAGVELFTLDPLGGAGESYAELMLRNAATIREALGSWEPR